MHRSGVGATAPGQVHEVPLHTPPRNQACAVCGAMLAGSASSSAGWVVLGAVVPQQIAAALLRTDKLSGREQTVFELLGLGYDNRSLARELEVSERTAKRHVSAILAKLGLESRLQAGLTAMLTLSCRGQGRQDLPSFAEWPEGRIDPPR